MRYTNIYTFSYHFFYYVLYIKSEKKNVTMFD